MKKIVFPFLLGLLITIGAYLLYVYVSYVDDKITTGNGYGFSIGDSKLDTYKKASSMPIHLDLGNSPIFIETTIDENNTTSLATNVGYTVMVQTLLHEKGFSIFESKDKWNFYFNGTYFDSLSLKFCNEKLCEIYRHRKTYEFP